MPLSLSKLPDLGFFLLLLLRLGPFLLHVPESFVIAKCFKQTNLIKENIVTMLVQVPFRVCMLRDIFLCQAVGNKHPIQVEYKP